MKELSTRLQMIAKQMGKVTCFADIGSDHGLLPIALVASGQADAAIAVEVVKGPYAVTRQAIMAAHMQDRIEARLGDGVAPLQPDEVDQIVIAGMGAETMWDILTTAHADTILASDRHVSLVLQPMANGGLMRYYAEQAGYILSEDQRVIDNQMRYEVMRLDLSQEVDRRNMQPNANRLREAYQKLAPHDQWMYTFGLQGLTMQCPHVLAQIKEELEKLEWIIHSLKESDTLRAKQRMECMDMDRMALNHLLMTYYSDLSPKAARL